MGNNDFIFLFSLGIGLITALFISTPKTPVGNNENNHQTLRNLIEAFNNKSFIFLTLGFFVCGWHIALVATHIPTYMMDRGMPDWTAAMILALVGVFNMIGTMGRVILQHKFSKRKY